MSANSGWRRFALAVRPSDLPPSPGRRNPVAFYLRVQNGSLSQMAGRLHIQVLGDLIVTSGLEPVDLPASKKTRALLAYLAVSGRRHSRERLCRLLWDIPEDPRASLRWSLYKLRQVTNAGGRNCLETDRKTVFLNPRDIELDFRQVDQLTLEGISALEPATLESIADSIRGEFLEDLSLPRCPKFEAWRIYYADRLSRLRAEVVRVLMNRSSDDPERTFRYTSMLRDCADWEELPAHPSLSEARISDQRSGSLTGKAGQAAPAPKHPAPPQAVSLATDRRQEIRFCTSQDGVQIAYAKAGQGAPLVRAAHWMSHLQYDWESPVWRHWMEALTRHTTLVRYDQRGNGLSDWEVGDFGFEAMLADLEEVVDAAGMDQFTLLGVSQSCALSMAYAVRHPQRVSGLILYGGFVKGWRHRGDSHEIATHEAMTTLIKEGWGQDNPAFRHVFTQLFIPGGSEEQSAWFDELQRVSVSPDNASQLHDAFGEIDVSPLLPEVRVPTLVLHARRDAAVPFASGREFATGIRGARFVELDSANHILLATEPAFMRFVSEVQTFVSGTHGRPR